MEKTSKYHIEKNRSLIEACKKNDRKAQIEVYDLYYKAMYNASLRIVNDSLLAEDIMQESFLDAFQKLDSFEWRSSFGSWLKRIVINKSLDKIRRKLNEVSMDDVEEEIVLNDNNNDERDVECELEDVRYALKLLPENYRLIIVLHLFEGYDHQEISQILNTSYNNVRVRYLRARNKLVDKIKELKGSHTLN